MSSSTRRLYKFEDFLLDPAERLLLRAGVPVALTPKAFETLVMLVSNSNRLVTKEELMRAVWADAAVEENNLEKNISALRKALDEQETGRKLIETVRGHGYRFTATVTETEAGQGAPIRGAVNGRPELIHLIEDQPVAAAPLADSAAVPIPVNAQPGENFILWIGQHRGPLLTIALLLLAITTSIRLWRFKGQPEERPRETTVTRLTNGDDIHSLTLAPDGKYFVYVEQVGGATRLCVRQVAGGQPLEIVPALEQYVVGTTFSPDSQFVYFVTVEKRDPQGALYRVPALGGPVTKLLTGITSPVTFAPDGRRLAFVRWIREGEQSSLIIAGGEGGNAQAVLKRSGQELLGATGPAWSPDGREIACQFLSASDQPGSAYWSVVGVNVQSGATRALTTQKWDGCGRLAWLGDGRGLVLIGTRQGESGTTARDQVWYLAQPDGAVRRITTDLNRHDYNSLGVTRDGQALLILPYNRTSQIWSVQARGRDELVRYDARTAVQLTGGTAEGRAGIVSLDDGRIVYVARTGDHVDLWQMYSDGSELKQLTTDPPFLEEVTAPSDGRFLVFASNRAGHSHLFRVERDGASLRQLTGGDSSEVDSDCSPDGRWIVYSSLPIVSDKIEKNKLWKIPAEGGAPVHLTEREANTPRFSPDGKWISYIYPGELLGMKLAVIPADGGAPVKTFDVLDGAILNVGCRWTPDGQALVYIVTNKNVSNLWMQPLNGGAPYPLTDFSSGQIYNFAFARDGQHLFLARGYPIRDVLRIQNFR